MISKHITTGYSPSSTATVRRLLLLGAGVIAVVTLVVGAFVLGRATSTSDRASAAAEPAGVPFRDGVPVPTRRSPAGAASSAANFQIAGFRVSTGTLDATSAATVLLAADATPSARQVVAAPAASAEQLATSRTTFAALSTVVVEFTPDRAVVLVWGVAASAPRDREAPGTETWGRSTITQVWTGGQWRILDQRYERGPWPVRSDQRLAASEGDFTFRMKEIVEQGWTYVPEP